VCVYIYVCDGVRKSMRTAILRFWIWRQKSSIYVCLRNICVQKSSICVLVHVCLSQDAGWENDEDGDFEVLDLASKIKYVCVFTCMCVTGCGLGK